MTNMTQKEIDAVLELRKTEQAELAEFINTYLCRRGIHTKCDLNPYEWVQGKIEGETDEFQTTPVLFKSLTAFAKGTWKEATRVLKDRDGNVVREEPCIEGYVSLGVEWRRFQDGNNSVNLCSFRFRRLSKPVAYMGFFELEEF